MVDVADQVRFIQHGVVENRICASEPSQRGRAEVIFEAKKNPGGTPAARRRLAGSFAFCPFCSPFLRNPLLVLVFSGIISGVLLSGFCKLRIWEKPVIIRKLLYIGKSLMAKL